MAIFHSYCHKLPEGRWCKWMMKGGKYPFQETSTCEHGWHGRSLSFLRFFVVDNSRQYLFTSFDQSRLVVWNMCFFHSVGKNHPNPYFFRGVADWWTTLGGQEFVDETWWYHHWIPGPMRQGNSECRSFLLNLSTKMGPWKGTYVCHICILGRS